MSQIYSYTDYRAFLRQTIASAPEGDKSWGGITRWTSAIGCQRSHGSRVLSGEKDLNPEQALATAEFLDLGDSETDYFLLMADYAKAGSKALKERVYKKMKSIKKEQDSVAQTLQQPRVGNSNDEALYYSAWYWSAIHILTSIPGFSTPAKIAAKLRLPVPLVEMTLAQLADLNLIKKQGAHYSFASSSIHLPKNSAMVSVHHMNWRQRAIVDAQDLNAGGFHYTVVQSISASDFDKFHSRLFKLVEEFQKMASPSKPEELVSFSFDFFKA